MAHRALTFFDWRVRHPVAPCKRVTHDASVEYGLGCARGARRPTSCTVQARETHLTLLRGSARRGAAILDSVEVSIRFCFFRLIHQSLVASQSVSLNSSKRIGQRNSHYRIQKVASVLTFNLYDQRVLISVSICISIFVSVNSPLPWSAFVKVGPLLLLFSSFGGGVFSGWFWGSLW